MRKLFAVPAVIAGLTLAGSAGAQVVVPPGQDFYATPLSKDGISMGGPARIVTAAPAPAKASKKLRRK